MTIALTDLAGWAGAGLMLLAYGLLASGRIPAGPAFHGLNLSGAIGLLISAATHGAWPSVTLNLAWSVISLRTLLQQRERGSLVGSKPLRYWIRESGQHMRRLPIAGGRPPVPGPSPLPDPWHTGRFPTPL